MAGTVERTLALKLIADVGGLNKGMKQTQGTLKRTASAAKSWGKALTGALVIKGVETLVSSLDDAFKGFKEGEDAARNVSRTWKKLGLDTDQLADTLDRLGESALDLGFDDAEVTSAFNTFLAMTGDADKSARLVARAMDFARAKGIPFATAVKKIGTDLDETNAAFRRSEGAANDWARNNALTVNIGKITAGWEDFVGNLARGNFGGAIGGLQGIAKAIDEIIFGTTEFQQVAGEGGAVKPIKTGGILNEFKAIGEGLAPAIVEGAAGLGAAILGFYQTEIEGKDWGKAIGDAIGAGLLLAQENPTVATNLAILAVGLAASLFVASIFANALATMLKAPAIIGKGVVSAAIEVLGTTLLYALRAAMFLAQAAIDAMTSGLSFLISSLPIGPGSKIGTAAFGLGTAIQGMIAAGIAIGLPVAIAAIVSAVLQEALNNILPGGTRLRYNPDTGRMERYAKGTDSAAGGMALVGEQGPELVNLPKGAKVYTAAETAGMMGGGWGGGWNLTINTGVGDPVEIGRQVDRVLRAYRGRAGLPA